MKWEYAALELIYNVHKHIGSSEMWVLRKTRPNTGEGGSRTVFVNFQNAGEILFNGTSSIDIVNLAGKAGWEMTSPLPIGVDKKGRIETCSLMRRRID